MSNLPPEATSETLSAEIRKLGHILGETIVKLEGKAIFDLEEKLRLLAKSSRGGDAKAEKELRAAVQKLTAGRRPRGWPWPSPSTSSWSTSPRKRIASASCAAAATPSTPCPARRR